MNNPFFGALGGGNSFMQMLQQFCTEACHVHVRRAFALATLTSQA